MEPARLVEERNPLGQLPQGGCATGPGRPGRGPDSRPDGSADGHRLGLAAGPMGSVSPENPVAVSPAR